MAAHHQASKIQIKKALLERAGAKKAAKKLKTKTGKPVKGASNEQLKNAAKKM